MATFNLTPNTAPQHWTAEHIGKPWELGAEGPAAFDCWGLARWVQRERYTRELPQLRVATRLHPGEEQTGVLMDLMRRTGWRLLPDWQAMADGDLLRMQSPMGPHIGVVVHRGLHQPLAVLHCVGGVDFEGRSHGAVELAEPRQLVSEGFGQFQAWGWRS